MYSKVQACRSFAWQSQESERTHGRGFEPRDWEGLSLMSLSAVFLSVTVSICGAATIIASPWRWQTIRDISVCIRPREQPGQPHFVHLCTPRVRFHFIQTGHTGIDWWVFSKYHHYIDPLVNDLCECFSALPGQEGEISVYIILVLCWICTTFEISQIT